MKCSAIVAILVGLVLAITLVVENDFDRIAVLVMSAGWSILIVVLLHVPQTICATMGWRALLPATMLDSSTLFCLRWVRDSVNTLLPVAHVGGDIVRIRMLARTGMVLPDAAASTVVDLTLEVFTQLAFTILALLLLFMGSQGGDAMPLALATLAGCALLTVSLVMAKRLGVLQIIERRLSHETGAFMHIRLVGMHEAVVALYQQRRRIVPAALFHFLAWALGSVETLAAAWVLGIDLSWREAFIIEALAHAARAVGFLIPGALGAQEGGYVLVCAIFGVGPQDALALSLIRRIRELMLGLPGLLLWHRLERGTNALSYEESSSA